MALISTTTLKEYLPEIQGTGADSELTSLLSRVEVAVASYLGFPMINTGSTYKCTMEANTTTQYYDGPTFSNGLLLDLRVKPVISVTSVHSDPYQEYGSDTLIPASTYEVDLLKGHIRLLPKNVTEVFERGYRAIKVVFVAGYSSSNIPPDIQHAICVYASQLHRNKTTQGKETVSQRGGSVNISPKTMPQEVKQLLNPYRMSGVIL